MEQYKDVIEVVVGIITIVGAIFGGWRWFAWLRKRDAREIATIYADGMKQVSEAIAATVRDARDDTDRHNQNERRIERLEEEHADLKEMVTDIHGDVKMLIKKMIPEAASDDRRKTGKTE